MNSFHESPQSDATALIDRLVAGELTEVERRELLLSLESEPDGWRRCALAFLEDQAWRTRLFGRRPCRRCPRFPARASGDGWRWSRRSWR
jgi:hypothetical protein